MYHKFPDLAEGPLVPINNFKEKCQIRKEDLLIHKELKFVPVSQIKRSNLIIQIEKTTYKSYSRKEQNCHPHCQTLVTDRRSEMLDRRGLGFENESRGVKLDESRCVLVWRASASRPIWV